MGKYIESVLSSGEQVEAEAQVTLWPAMISLVIGILTLIIYIGVIFLIAALVFFLRAKSTELAVTNKKVIGKWGIIQRDSIELLLPKVEAVRVQQPILGRIFNYGTLVIAGTGNATPIPLITNPLGFRKKFMEAQERSTAAAAAQGR